MNLFDIVNPMSMDEAKATKQRLDAKCWKGKHKEGTKVKGGVRVNNCVPNTSVKEDNFHGAQDDWHAGDNAWSSENHEMVESHSFSNGDQVELKPEYADRAGEVYTVSQCDVERGRCWIGDTDGRGWYANFNQLVPGVSQDDVDEGYQDFNKVEPYAVCLAGKPIKKFDYYEEARKFHDNWKQKLYNQGEKAKAEKITLMPLNLDESTGIHPKLVTVLKQRGYKGPYKLSKLPKWLASLGDVANGDDDIMVTGNDPEYDAWVVYNAYGPYAFGQEMGYQMGTAAKVIKDTVPLDEAGKGTPVPVKDFVKGVLKDLKKVNVKETGDRVDPLLIRALERMPDGLASHGEVLNACYDAYAMELGKMRMKSEYGTTNVYVPKLMDLYKQKHELTFKETATPAQQAAIAIAKKKEVKESYWTKLQNERNTKIASMINELTESVKKIK